ncbi:MAG: putative ral secretion pathway protein (Type traffic warden ATPase) [Armatimonadetes bacterium]|jgi:type II secretion system protein E|nr:putative ral secretion pathway protein (Type traffic warden ATPase) [Armatimonadota bacterium]
MPETIAQVLVRSGKLTAERLARAQQEQDRSGRPLPEMLVRLGYCAETDIQRAFAESLGIPILDSSVRPEAEALSLVSAGLAQKHMIVPIRRENGSVVVALADPMNLTALDDVRLATGLHVQPAYADREVIERLVTDAYSAEEGEGDFEVVQEEGENVAELHRLAREALVVRLVTNVFREAVRSRASDIHIESFEDRAQVRYRIDGVLQEQAPPPQRLMPAIVSRVKILADLDIAERRLPQDGRIKTHILGKEIDIRVSTLPTLHGEAVVMRLLDQSSIQHSLEDIGFTELQLSVFEKAINRPYGMVLVTGPTGSGKTTTLYASLRRIFSPGKKIITVEDPVEYQMSGVNQMQVRERIGLTFSRGLRAIVRQDPDIIMVGEIRDKETMEIAVHAALTGHLLLSTLHTNDAAGAVSRLVDMGLEPFLAASSLECVMAQRLARRVCPECREEQTPPHEMMMIMERELGYAPPSRQLRGVGCSTCRFTGFSGRLGLFEILPISDEVRDLILDEKSAGHIKASAVAGGMTTLRQDGWRKVLAGQTTIEEVIRVSTEDD